MNTPTLNPIYNFKTSYTKDEAVQYLLGWLKESQTITANCLSEEEIHERYLNDEYEEYDPTLHEIIVETREHYVADYLNAKYEGDGESEALAKLNDCDLEIIKAHEYLCLIDDELAKGTDSELRGVINAAGGLDITVISLKAWAKDIVKNNAGVNLREEHNHINETGRSKTQETNLLVKFALLVEAYAETNKRFILNDRLNAKAISGSLVKRANNSKPPINGVSQSGMDKVIAAAMKAKNHT